MPVLFIGHGSPMNAIEDNEFRQSWVQLGKRLPKPDAIICISAHWETNGSLVTAMEKPKTIHDFYGFPQELFAVQYTAPGSPALASKISQLTGAKLDHEWGLDHGAWGVLQPMYPAADIPILQLSLDKGKTPQQHYEFAKKLSSLRNENILIIGSGNIVHNLRRFSFQQMEPYEWAASFNNKIKELVTAGNHEEIINFSSLENYLLSVPTAEHFLPVLYILALQENGEEIEFFNNKVLSSISMSSVIIG